MDYLPEETKADHFECPICLAVLIHPITLTCGHTFCEVCIKDDLLAKKVCPVCRKKILVKMSLFKVNVLLDQLLCEKYKSEKDYKERRMASRKAHEPQKFEWLDMVKKLAAEKLPWIIIALLLYHLVRVKLNVFNLLIEKYKSKALSIADSIKKENSLDFKFILFSQFIRILFSNLVIT